MPYRPPKEIPEVSIEDIWDWVARTLTDPASYKADVSALLTAAHFDLAEFEVSYPIGNQTPAHWNDTAEHVVAMLDVILVDIPSGASRVREPLILVMDIMALEAPGGVQKIDVQIESRKAGGSWGVAWTEDNIMSLPDVDGARDSLVMICDATGLFDGAGTYEFQAKIQASLAKDTQYICSGIYAIRYKMA